MTLVSSKADPDKMGPKDAAVYILILGCVLGAFYIFQKAREWYSRSVDLKNHGDERKRTSSL
jgi:hypothetical protein